MSLVVGVLLAAGILLWPGHFDLRRLAILRPISTDAVRGRRAEDLSALGPLMERVRPGRARRTARVSAPDLLDLLEAIAPALEAGLSPASALRIAAEARSGSGRVDPLVALASAMATAADDGVPLGSLWRQEARSQGSAELLLLSQAWSLTEDLGSPLAGAVRTTAGMLEARIAQERRLTAALAGARATVNLLTLLPVGGPLVALVLGIGPAELFGSSVLTGASLVLGLCLAAGGRLWVRRMVRAVARGPVMA